MKLLPRRSTSALPSVGIPTEIVGAGLMLESMLPSRIEMPPIFGYVMNSLFSVLLHKRSEEKGQGI